MSAHHPTKPEYVFTKRPQVQNQGVRNCSRGQCRATDRGQPGRLSFVGCEASYAANSAKFS